MIDATIYDDNENPSSGPVDFSGFWCPGKYWVQATPNAGWRGRMMHTSVIFDNKMWVIGGWTGYQYANDVWYSVDGISWTQATANAGWTARAGHTSVVLDNKMWVMGGGTGSTSNDVWYSMDGATLTRATANTAWKTRWNHTSVVTSDGKIWVLGGDVGISLKNDIWCSTDGVSWAHATTNAGWEARKNSTSVMHQNKMWVIGGWTTVRTNDVWYSDLSFGSLSSRGGSRPAPTDEAAARGATQSEAVEKYVFKLYQPSPNPSISGATLRYSVAEETQVEFLLYDVSGRVVKNLFSRKVKPGYHTINLDTLSSEKVSLTTLAL